MLEISKPQTWVEEVGTQTGAVFHVTTWLHVLTSLSLKVIQTWRAVS